MKVNDTFIKPYQNMSMLILESEDVLLLLSWTPAVSHFHADRGEAAPLSQAYSTPQTQVL